MENTTSSKLVFRQAGLWTMTFGGIGATLRALQDYGVTHEHLARLRAEPDYAKRVAEFMLCGGIIEDNIHQKMVRKTMGKNFFGVKEAIKLFGVNPSKQQLAVLAEIPLSEATLEECKNTHILVAVFPMSILDIRDKVERKLFHRHEDAWYNNQAIAKDHGRVGWYLVRKSPVQNSTNKNWSGQQALLSKDEETPSARVMVYAIIGHYLAIGERLFESFYIRCSDLDSLGNRVVVGDFGRGLNINGWDDDDWDSCLGLAGSRKF